MNSVVTGAGAGAPPPAVDPAKTLTWRRKLGRLLGEAVVAIAIGMVAAWLVPIFMGEEFLVRQIARVYAPLLGDLHGAARRDEVSVMLIDDTSLQSAEQSWPADYGYYARLLDAMAPYKPRAVFFDIAFASPRKDASLDRLIAAACRARAADVRVYMAARRDPAGHYLLRPELEALVPRCIQKVAIEYKPDAADQMAWTYPLSTDTADDAQGVRSVAPAIYQDLGGKLPAHPHSDLSVNWGLRPADRGIDWLEAGPSSGHGSGHQVATAVEPTPYCRQPDDPYLALLIPGPVRDLFDKGSKRPVCVFHNTLYPSDLQTSSEAEERVLTRHLTGRVVMVGTALLGSNDRVLSPLHGRIPGVYMHAMALDNLLTYGDDYKRAAHLGFGADGRRVLALVFFGIVLIVFGRLLSERFKKAWLARIASRPEGRRRKFHEACRWLTWKLGRLLLYSVFFVVMLKIGQALDLGFLTVVHVALFSFAAEWLEWNEKLMEWWRGEHKEKTENTPLDHPQSPTDTSIQGASR